MARPCSLPENITLFSFPTERSKSYNLYTIFAAKALRAALCFKFISGRHLRPIGANVRSAAHLLHFLLAFNKPENGKETNMPLTQMRSPCHLRSSAPVQAKVRPVAKCPSPLVPEAKVKEMLRDIAFVLHVTRRLSNEIREPKPCAEAIEG
jgi:hypothetical protein